MKKPTHPEHLITQEIQLHISSVKMSLMARISTHIVISSNKTGKQKFLFIYKISCMSALVYPQTFSANFEGKQREISIT